MQFIPIKTRPMKPPKDDLYAVCDEYLPKVQEGDVLLVTSKVLSIHQGRCVRAQDTPDKLALIRQEAEQYLEPDPAAPHPVMLAIKHHTLIASAGIDESNADGHYVLWPEHIQQAAKDIWQKVRARHSVSNLGVIITDSRSLPLRFGVSGVAIGFWGFVPTIDLCGKPDLFGRQLATTKQNVPDALAAIGVLMMGEADECTPLLIARGLPLQFTEVDTGHLFWVDQKNDIFKPLLDVFNI